MKSAPAVPRPTAAQDALLHALARYVETLHARYPEGPDQLPREGLAARGNMPVVNDRKRPKSAA